MEILNELNFIVKEPKKGDFKFNWEFYKKISKDVKISNKLNNFLKNKSVIIVGPSSNLINKRRGKIWN